MLNGVVDLRVFGSPVKVVVTDRMHRKAEEFTDNVYGTVDYSDSNQFSIEKIKNDHFISKLGEECVKEVFGRYFDEEDIEGPDYEIYEGKDKSWDEDLKIKGLGVGVKTQKRSMAEEYGLSWTFQSGEKRKDKVLSDDEAWVCFVEYNDDRGDECIVFPPYQVNELEFKDPMKPQLKGEKKVVYAKDILGVVDRVLYEFLK